MILSATFSYWMSLIFELEEDWLLEYLLTVKKSSCEVWERK